MTYTHRYIGPDTKDGLLTGVLCTIVGKRAGGKLIRTIAGERYLVGKQQLLKF